MARPKKGKATRHVKGKKRAHNEVVDIAAGTTDDEVPNDSPMRTRGGASRLRVSTGSDVEVDDDVEEDDDAEEDELSGDELKARPPTTVPSRRFAPPGNLAK